MASIIKDKARVYNANQFLNSFSNGSIDTWSTGTVYTTNETIINNGREYVATTTGTSGATPPTHVTGVLSDGGVNWQYVKVSLITNFYNNNLFISVGRPTPWDDENFPPQAENTEELDYANLADSMFMKKISSAGATMGIKRNQWDVTGVTYDPFKINIELDTINYYVTNASNRIYICLDNNNGTISTSEPTDTNTVVDSFKTGDGYTWKYIGEVSDLNFISVDYVPVVKILSDNASDQWAIQQNAKHNAILYVNIIDSGTTYPTADPVISIDGSAVAVASTTGGVLDEITLVDVGSGYISIPYVAVYPDVIDLSSHQPTMTVNETGGVIDSISISNAGQYNTNNTILTSISSTGTGAVITPEFTDFILTGFNISNGGTGYSDGDIVTLNDGDGNTEAHDVSIISNIGSYNGLGLNILEDCNAKYIIINDNIVADEAGYIEDDVTFRQILLVADPVDANGDVASSTRYMGPANANYATTANNLKVMTGSGSQLYTDNIEFIQRTSNQQENIKIILKF